MPVRTYTKLSSTYWDLSPGGGGGTNNTNSRHGWKVVSCKIILCLVIRKGGCDNRYVIYIVVYKIALLAFFYSVRIGARFKYTLMGVMVSFNVRK